MESTLGPLGFTVSYRCDDCCELCRTMNENELIDVMNGVSEEVGMFPR